MSARGRRTSKELACLLEGVSGRAFGEGDATRTFVSLGFDSLLLTQVALRVTEDFGIPIRLRRLLEDLSSLEALAAHLDGRLPAEAPRSPGTAFAATDAPAQAATRRARASDDESAVLARVLIRQLSVMARQIELIAGGATRARASTLARALEASEPDASAPPQACDEDSAPPTVRDRGIAGEIDDGALPSPLPGARLGRDANGNPAWFVPDPERPGMFQQVEVAS